MSRTHYTLQESIAVNESLRRGPLAARYHEAFKACRDLWATLHNTPIALAILSEQMGETDDDPARALKRLADQAEAMHNKIRQVMTETDRACSAERKRLKDTLDTAISYRVDLAGRRNQIARQLERGATPETMERRAALSKAGVAQCDIERLAPLDDHAELRAQIAEIDAEDAKLGAFIRSMNEGDLPDGFDDHVRAYRELQEQRRTIEGPRLSVMGP